MNKNIAWIVFGIAVLLFLMLFWWVQSQNSALETTGLSIPVQAHVSDEGKKTDQDSAQDPEEASQPEQETIGESEAQEEDVLEGPSNELPPEPLDPALTDIITP